MGKGKSTGDEKKEDTDDATKAKASLLEEDGKTTTAEPTKAKDTAGKGKSTGDEEKEDNNKDANKEKAKGSILEKDDKTTTAVPTKAATKDAKKGDDAGKGKSTGDEKKKDTDDA